MVSKVFHCRKKKRVCSNKISKIIFEIFKHLLNGLGRRWVHGSHFPLGVRRRVSADLLSLEGLLVFSKVDFIMMLLPQGLTFKLFFSGFPTKND